MGTSPIWQTAILCCMFSHASGTIQSSLMLSFKLQCYCLGLLVAGRFQKLSEVDLCFFWPTCPVLSCQTNPLPALRFSLCFQTKPHLQKDQSLVCICYDVFSSNPAYPVLCCISWHPICHDTGISHAPPVYLFGVAYWCMYFVSMLW